MAETRISLLPSAGPILGDEVVPLNQGGVTKRARVRELRGGIARSVGNVSSVLLTSDDMGGTLAVFPAAGGCEVIMDVLGAPDLVTHGAMYRVLLVGPSAPDRPLTLTVTGPSSLMGDGRTYADKRVFYSGEAIVVQVFQGILRVSTERIPVTPPLNYGTGGAPISGPVRLYWGPGDVRYRFASAAATTCHLQSAAAAYAVPGALISVVQVGEGAVDLVAAPDAPVPTVLVPAGRIARTAGRGARVDLYLVSSTGGGVWELTGDLAAA